MNSSVKFDLRLTKLRRIKEDLVEKHLKERVWIREYVVCMGHTNELYFGSRPIDCCVKWINLYKAFIQSIQ